MYDHDDFQQSLRAARQTCRPAGIRRLTAWMLLLSSSVFAADQSWQSTEQPDPINGGTLAIAETATENARIMVRCESSRRWLEVRVFLDQPVADPAVTWQFDATFPRSQRWLRSPNNLSLILPQGNRDDFIFRLQAYRTLLLTIDGAQLRVPLNGSAKAIAQATSSCRS